MSGRVFLVRHGETEWSKNGRHTGTTDIPLTQAGEDRVVKSAKVLVGPGKLVDVDTIGKIYVSPRQRARRTLQLLQTDSSVEPEETADICEWDYGEYEGLTSPQINELRKDSRSDWNVFRDGCPQGDTAQTVQTRLDRLIASIRVFHKNAAQGEASGRPDVLVVAHGHILRAFAARWIGDPVTTGTRLLYSAGGVSVLAYEHHSWDEPTISVWNVTADLWQ